MKLSEIVETLEAKVLADDGEGESLEIKEVCSSDLMSDVLRYAESRSTLLLTGLTTPQVIYTAEMVDIKAICFVRGKSPDPEVVELARKRKIILLSTSLPMFESCGRLYMKGLKGSFRRIENK